MGTQIRGRGRTDRVSGQPDGNRALSGSAASLAKSIRDDGSRLADALDRTATALGETGAPESPYTSPGSGHVVVEAFRTVGRDGEDTNYEMTGDLIVELQKGGTITTGTVRREVLVLLDVDDEPYSVVRVQKGPESDLATVEQALRHLTHAWDDVRRPPWRVGATA